MITWTTSLHITLQSSMDSLSLCLSSSPLLKPIKTPLKNPQKTLQIPLFTSLNHQKTLISTFLHSNPTKTSLKLHFSIPISIGFLNSLTLPSLASEIIDPSSQRINLETTLVQIDDFFNKYPYLVFSLTFIWLIVIPLVEEYLYKYQFISALNAFKKLRDDKSAQLLDIRDDKSLGFLSSPNLRFLNKNVVHVAFNEGDEDGFVKNVKANFDDPQNTIICILDNFDGNSMKVAELLFNNGFKEAYAIKGGVRGKKGWQEIQEEFLPPAVHVFRRKKVQTAQQREENGAATQSNGDQVPAVTSDK